MPKRRLSHPINKSEQVARLLLDRIIALKVAPGSSLGTEAELLEMFHVSRPTLRESLRTLEAQGVLVLRPGPKGGIIVAEPRIDPLAHTLSVLLRLNDISFGAVLSARFAIEPVLARGAALNGVEEDFRAMDATVERLQAAGTDMQVIYRENREFHNLIAKAAHNPVLEVFWSSIRILASGEGAGLRYSERNRVHIISSHKKIIAALRAHDADLAENLVLDHLGELQTLLRRRHVAELDQPTRIAFTSGLRS